MTPAFDNSKVAVFYVLGGPGAGVFIRVHDAHAIRTINSREGHSVF